MGDHMKVQFLGTGTSSGVPVIGCTCKVCSSKDPKDYRKRCSLLLTFNNINILIDAGPDIRTQLLSIKLQKIDAILITHSHYDHVIGLDELRPITEKNNISLPIYSDLLTYKGIKIFFSYLFLDKPLQLGGGLTKFTHHLIEAFSSFYIQDILIEPLQVYHGKLPILGYKIGSLAYLTDVKTLPSDTINKIKNIDTLIISCLRPKLHSTHINIKEMLPLVTLINPRRCFLIHMTHDLLHQEWVDLLPNHIHPAYDHLEILIP